jgi:hypothetical protein
VKAKITDKSVLFVERNCFSIAINFYVHACVYLQQNICVYIKKVRILKKCARLPPAAKKPLVFLDVIYWTFEKLNWEDQLYSMPEAPIQVKTGMRLRFGLLESIVRGLSLDSIP